MSHFSLEVFGSVFHGYINYSFKMSITTLQYNGITNNEFQWSIRLKIQLFPKTGNAIISQNVRYDGLCTW